MTVVADAVSPLRVRVIRVVQEAVDIRSYELARVDGQPMPAFNAGAHVDVFIAPALTRQYSLCGHPNVLSSYTIAVKLEAHSRGGSKAMHESLSEGSELSISRPRNNFGLAVDAQRHVLVAGGVGITPLLSMVEQLSGGVAAYQLHYFSRSEQHAAFRKHLAQGRFRTNVRAHYALEPDAMDGYLRQVLPAYKAGSCMYLCGPAPFMAAVRQQALGLGWPVAQVRLENFSADTAVLEQPTEAFTVRLARTGASYEVPAGQSIVDALAAQGVHLLTSCGEGVCGTCMTDVLDGVPDHRDNYLTQEERAAGDKIMPCVSRARTGLLVLNC